ncbi:hypothetical protein, partial [Klebsiella pneumoniae]
RIGNCQSGSWKKQGGSVTFGPETMVNGVSYNYMWNGFDGPVRCPDGQVIVGLYRTSADDYFHFLCRKLL